MIELRPYQRAAIDSTLAYWSDGGGNPLIEMATGTGKSVVIATLTRELLESFPDMRVLILVHVKELVEQNAQAMLRTWPQAPIGINCAGLDRRDKHSQILFASIQSVHRDDAYSLGKRDLVLVDEAHLVPRSGDGMYLKLLERLRDRVPDMRVAGFTATPYRLDSGRLDQGKERLFDSIAYTYGIADGVADRWLSPLVSKATGTEIDVSGVARRGGEFIAGELERAADVHSVVEGAADEIVARGADRRGWLVFCAGIEHAGHVRDALKRRDVACETITSETPNHDRDRIIRAYRKGELRCLTNANVLTTGFDVPHVDLIAMLRPTLSTGLYVQSLGRGTRIAEGKTECLVLDFAGNVRRHGPVDAISVSGKSPGGKEAGVKPETVRAKVCPVCESYVALATFTCAHCGHEWEKPEPKHVAKADTAPVMASRGPAWLAVDDVILHRHEKLDSPPSLRVEYVCGLQTYREWVTLEHRGFSRAKAEAWWSAMGGARPAPVTVTDALKRAIELGMPTHITIARDGKYWRINGHRIERNGRLYEIDQQYRIRPMMTESEAA
jgi:DNA repair protein RadD